ncbi:MAG: hypothetical protein PHP06_05620 [Clostridia bacterium]|nr:hypothetical protein [Clostridia bacterium]
MNEPKKFKYAKLNKNHEKELKRAEELINQNKKEEEKVFLMALKREQ